MSASTKKRAARKPEGIDVRRAVYCARHGHSRVVSFCMGYVNCARCDAQLGDTLGGVYEMSDKVVIGHACNVCIEQAATLSKHDRALLPDNAVAYLDELAKAGAA